MSKLIAILEDDAARILAMRQWLAMRYSMYEQVFFGEAAPLIEWLGDHVGETSLISLDHDLEPPLGSSPNYDSGTGRDVANFLAAQVPSCPIIIHSTNVPAALGMMFVLQDACWQVQKVLPYEDTLWIKEIWGPMVRQLIAE